MARHLSPHGRGGASSTWPEPAEIVIERIGADGDGIAYLADRTPVFIGEALPRETVLMQPFGRQGGGFAAAATVIDASADRVEPPCPHFGRAGDQCGGCTLQHWQDAPYAGWKRDQLAAALRRAGIPDPTVAPLNRTPPGARRRMDLALQRQGGQVRIGLHVRRSQAVVDIQSCQVLHPRLLRLVQALRPVLRQVSALRRSGSAIVNLLQAGPDLLLRTDGSISALDRTLLSEFGRSHDLPRITWARGDALPEPVCLLRPPRTKLGLLEIEPPPGAFLQASDQGEAAIIAAVYAALPQPMPRRARIVELYAGCGTLTAALAAHAGVDAFEGDAAACTALRRATIPGVSVQQRDLTRQPLQAKELQGAAAVVLDPPWAGAQAQMPAIAASSVPVVCYVSCNPDALARDARFLIDTGYALDAATPIDQFLWSARIESVCVFKRAPRRRPA